jgi:hypothetical protein
MNVARRKFPNGQEALSGNYNNNKMGRIFKINDRIEIVCESEGTRMA